MSVCFSVGLSLRMYGCLSPCMSTCRSDCLFVCLPLRMQFGSSSEALSLKLHRSELRLIETSLRVHILALLTPHNYQSISRNLYSAPSRYLLRGAPNPGQAEKNSLEEVVELRTGAVWEVP